MPRPAAFFDMDYTLVAANTAAMYVKFLRKEGLSSRRAVARTLWWSMRYRLGLLDLPSVVEKVVAGVAGESEEEMRRRCERWYAEEVVPFVSPDGREAVERHRSLGDVLVLLTGNSPYISGPLVADLRLDHTLCTRLEVDEGTGLFTGRITPPFAYGEGKVLLAEELAAKEDLDLEASTFYTDSHTDLPMLLRVGRPVVVNPDPKLAWEATRRDWPVMEFGIAEAGP